MWWLVLKDADTSALALSNKGLGSSYVYQIKG